MVKVNLALLPMAFSKAIMTKDQITTLSSSKFKDFSHLFLAISGPAEVREKYYEWFTMRVFMLKSNMFLVSKYAIFSPLLRCIFDFFN